MMNRPLGPEALTTLSSKMTFGSERMLTVKPCPEKNVASGVGPDTTVPDLSMISRAALTISTTLFGPAAALGSGGKQPQLEWAPSIPVTLTPTVATSTAEPCTFPL